MIDTGIALGAVYGVTCLGAIAFVKMRLMPVGIGTAEKAIAHLPETYRMVALREMDCTRRAGVTVNRRQLRFIVQAVERMAREHGAIA